MTAGHFLDLVTSLEKMVDHGILARTLDGETTRGALYAVTRLATNSQTPTALVVRTDHATGPLVIIPWHAVRDVRRSDE